MEYKMDSIDLIAFDFFDTIVHRKCHPEKIISLWAESVRYHFKIGLSKFEIYYLRKKSEEELRKKKKLGDVSYDQIMNKVYKKICEHGYLKEIDISSFLEYSKKIEYEYEKKNIFLDEETLKKIKYYYELKKKIIIISDFYFGKDLIYNICENLKIEKFFSDVYVSSDYNARKSTGELYKKVIRIQKISPERCLMIGDNKESDQNIPRRIGFNILPIESNNSTNEFFFKRKLVCNKIKKMCSRHSIFGGYAGIMYYFICKLHFYAINNNCSRLVFFSREGQLLKELFDFYQEYVDKRYRINTQYAYISRKATFLASLKLCQEEDFSRMFLNYKSLSLQDFLDNLGFSDKEIAYIVDNTNVNKNLMTCRRGLSPEFDNFLENSIFIRLYNQKRNEAVSLVSGYLNQISSDETMWVVDIGWRGSIQDNIYFTYAEQREIRGLYFGLKKALDYKKNMKVGIVFDDRNNTKLSCLLSFNYLDLEKVCSASHGPVEGYFQKDSTVYPMIKNNEQELAIYKYVKNEQQNLKNAFSEICKLLNNSVFDYSDLTFVLMNTYLYHLCVKQAQNYKFFFNYRNIVIENFGAKRTKVENKFSFKGYSEQFKWGLVNYVFRFLDKVNLRCFYPVGKAYCKLIYFIKENQLRNAISWSAHHGRLKM